MLLEKYFASAAIGLVTILLAVSAPGQQSIRTPEAPEYQTFLPQAPGPSLVRLGPFSGNLTVSAGYNFNDNAGTSETQKISRNQIFEDLLAELDWTLSPFNRIDVAFDGQLQENFYSNGANAINLEILPTSKIQFQARVGDVLLRAFDQFAVVQDPVTDPVVTGQSTLNRLTNTGGLAVTVPFDPFELGLEFDYTYSDTLGSTNIPGASSSFQSSGTVRNSLTLGASLGYQINSLVTSGVEFNASTNYGAGSNDVQSLSVGPFVKGSLTRLIEIDGGVGLLLLSAPQFDPTQYYAYVSIRYQITPISQLIAGISHDIEFSSGLDITRNNNFHLDLRTEPIRRWIVTVSPFVNFGTARAFVTQNSALLDSYTQYGVSIDSTFQLSSKLMADFNYRFARREGDQTGDSYTQNVVGISLQYKF